MARKRPKQLPPDADRAPFLGLTPNQVVGYNLTRARELKGWTQDQAGDALEPYLGVRWSKASISQAERSVAGGFVRNFTADEIVAFARAFDQPVTWFFMPPPAWAGPGMPTKLNLPDAPALGAAVAMLVDLVFGDEVQQAQLVLRLDAFLADLGPAGLTEAQSRIASMAGQRVAALVRESFSDLDQWQTSLRSLANQLEDLELRAKLVVAKEAGVEVKELRIPAGVVPAEALDSLAGTAADSPEAKGAEVEGDQPAGPSARKRRSPSAAKKTTRRKT
ncbi:MAG TPA: helix-turn-helix transcriptional regulator [Acidimicrobiales bacterium]|nr:helix-turn-helix transcriptional regulator [Acidimicrobiales bacterium]